MSEQVANQTEAEQSTVQELSNEQVLDMLPCAVDIYEKLDMDSYRKELTKKFKEKENFTQTDAGIDGFKFILKNTSKIKPEIFEMVGIVEGKTAEEIRKQSFFRTIGTFKAIFTNSELLDFFRSAMK